MNKSELTGRTRHRVLERSFRETLLVLQVEERHTGYYIDQYGAGPEYDYCDWRDATAQDITVQTGDKP